MRVIKGDVAKVTRERNSIGWRDTSNRRVVKEKVQRDGEHRYI